MPQDDAEAFRWFTRSADAGWSLAKLNLAGCYRDGRGCDVDDARAMALYVEAASNPSDPAACDAMERIGEAYRTGTCGVTVDHAEAARWFRGAEAGSVECAYRRGVCLATGEGVAATSETPWRRSVSRRRPATRARRWTTATAVRGIGVATDKARVPPRLAARRPRGGHVPLGMAHLRAAADAAGTARGEVAARRGGAGHPEAMLEYAAGGDRAPASRKHARGDGVVRARRRRRRRSRRRAGRRALRRHRGTRGAGPRRKRALVRARAPAGHARGGGRAEAGRDRENEGSRAARRAEAARSPRSSRNRHRSRWRFQKPRTRDRNERRARLKNTVKNTRELPACITPEGAVSRKPRPQPRAETMSRPAAAPMNRRATVSRTEAPPPKPAVEVKAPSQGGSGKSKKPKDATASHPDSPYAAPVARRKKNLTVK